MATTKNMLPDCGLYRTTKPLPGHENDIPAASLVYFHNHSDNGLATVTKPDHNVLNRWHFHGPPVELRALRWTSSLERVPSEGFYALKGEIAFEGGSWPKNTLVQLGYTRQGEPILFIGRVRAQLQENDLFFSDKGVPIERAQLRLLEALSVFVEESKSQDH